MRLIRSRPYELYVTLAVKKFPYVVIMTKKTQMKKKV